MPTDEQVAVPSPALTEAVPERGTLAEYDQASKLYLEPKEPKTADPAPAQDPAAPDKGESASPPAGEDNQAPKKKTLKDRNAELDADLAALNDKLKRRKEIREELAALDKPKTDAPPAPSPAAKTTDADGKPIKPKLDDFESWAKFDEARDEYFEKLADWKADQKFKEHDQRSAAEKRQETIRERWQPRIESGREAWDDFDDVALNQELRPFIQGAVGEFLNDSEAGEKLLYTLGLDLKNAERIAKLPAVAQFRELQKMETQFSEAEKPANGAKPVTPISKAPKPPTVLRGGGPPPDEEAAEIAAIASGDVGRALALINQRERAERKAQRG